MVQSHKHWARQFWSISKFEFKKLSQRFDLYRKFAFHPAFHLNEIDPLFMLIFFPLIVGTTAKNIERNLHIEFRGQWLRRGSGNFQTKFTFSLSIKTYKIQYINQLVLTMR